MNLSVIIPSRNADNLAACIRAVRDCDPDVNIVIVDDGVNWDVISEIGGSWASIKGQKPFVYARNCNIGINFCYPDDVILLNDDALLKTLFGFLELQAIAESHAEYGLIAASTNVTGEPMQKPRGVGLRELPRMVPFMCVLIPRRTIDTVGLLDEDFDGYGFEDDSYCLRVRRAGLKIGVYDHCFVDHGSLKSTFRGEKYPANGFERGKQIFIEKYGAYPL